MEIADYIPNYPELGDPDFNNQILHKKEFYELRTGAEKSPFGKPGDLWPHQKLLARFLAPYTPNNSQLIFHPPGTGKTCAAAAIVEINKQDPLIRKPVLIIVPNDTLVNQWKQQIALVCTNAIYVPENYFSTDPAEKLTDAERTTRLNKLIRPVYHITTIERMRRQIDKYKTPSGSQILRNRYSNTIIIIDEVHNLRIQTNTTQKNVINSKGRYKAFHRFLHLVVNCKKIFLSGTPMFDRITELPGLMNLILPLNEQFQTGKSFTNKYLQKKGHLRKIINQKELLSRLVGFISYIREGGNFPRRIDLGENLWTKFLKIMAVNMSDDQLAGYLQAYAQDTQTDGKIHTGLWKSSRQAAVFVYKEKDQYLWGTDVTKKLITPSKTRAAFIRGRKVTYTSTMIKPTYQKDLKDNLALYSAKFKMIVDFAVSHKNQPIFIFTPLVSGAGGAIFLGLILGLFGFTKAVGYETTKDLRYALITGDDKSSLQRKALIDMFNSKDNINGELIQIMIATKTISEGTSFTNVQHEIVVSPYWNNSGTEQAIGRGLRANSLITFPQDKRVVTVQQLASVAESLPSTKNIDIHMYKMSEAKDFEIKAAERILKKAAWDCALNYARNVRVTDTDGSRNCDYQKCNYVCYQTVPVKTEPKWTYNVPEQDLDESTYLLYYSKPELLQITEKIKKVLKKYSYIDVQGLHELLNINSFKIVVLAIEYIIENHVTVYNKWGQACFLRKEGNMLFLSDTPIEKHIQGSWYTQYPYANKQTPLTQIIDDELLGEDLPKLDNFDPHKRGAQQIINDMNIESQIFTLEALLSLKPQVRSEKEQKQYKAFLSLFEPHIFKVGDTIVHDLEKIKRPITFVDFTKGDGGILRCFKNGVWDACGKKEEEELATVIKDIKEVSSKGITDNKYGVYGIITTDGKFQIADKTKEKKTIKTKTGAKSSKTDHRTKYTGKVCNYWQKWQLIEIYLRIGAEPSIPINTKITTKADLLALIDKNNSSKAIPKNANIRTLQKIATLSKQKTVDLCNQLRKWFEENDLMVIQK